MYLARDGLRLTDGQDTQGVELSEPIRADFVGAASQTIYSDCLGDYTPAQTPILDEVIFDIRDPYHATGQPV